MRLIYMGTPDFAAAALEKLVEAGHDILAVVTQPDKKSGRGQGLIYSPVKEVALKHDIEVLQPVKARDEAFVEKIAGLEPEAIVVAAYGQILPLPFLAIPKYGCINIHASLLPAYRGAAPIQWSIIDGKETTGVTIMRMDEGIDTGDMILKEEVEICKSETGGSLHDKLSVAGAKLIVKALAQIEAGTATFTPQPEMSTTKYASMLKKDMGKIDWSKGAAEIERLIRGLDPWPSAYTFFKGKTLKIWKASVAENPLGLLPGMVFDVDKKGFKTACGDGALKIESLQIEGKKRMDTADFLRGNALSEGDRFGEGS